MPPRPRPAPPAPLSLQCQPPPPPPARQAAHLVAVIGPVSKHVLEQHTVVLIHLHGVGGWGESSGFRGF